MRMRQSRRLAIQRGRLRPDELRPVLSSARGAADAFLRRVSDVCVCTDDDAAPLLRRFGAPSDDHACVRLNYLEAELVAPPPPAG